MELTDFCLPAVVQVASPVVSLTSTARFVEVFAALEMLETFMQTEFEGGRHATRVNKISCI